MSRTARKVLEREGSKVADFVQTMFVMIGYIVVWAAIVVVGAAIVAAGGFLFGHLF